MTQLRHTCNANTQGHRPAVKRVVHEGAGALTAGGSLVWQGFTTTYWRGYRRYIQPAVAR